MSSLYSALFPSKIYWGALECNFMPLNTLLLKAMLPAIFIMGTHSMQQEKKKLYNDTLNLQLKEDLIWLLEILSNRKIYHKVFKTAFASERLYCIVAFQSPVYNLQFYFHIAFKKRFLDLYKCRMESNASIPAFMHSRGDKHHGTVSWTYTI